MLSFFKKWRHDKIQKIRRLLLENELESTSGDDESKMYSILRELWKIKSIVGSVSEKQQISPGMVHPGTLAWSRERAYREGFYESLFLEIESYSWWMILIMELDFG